MNDLATHLSGFLREHLPNERNASQHTCDTYAYSFRLLLEFAAARGKCQPSRLSLAQINAELVMEFLKYIEVERGNAARTRNARLAAIKSFFRYLECRLPSCIDQSRQIHAIPMKKTDQTLVDYLTREELQALLQAPDSSHGARHSRPTAARCRICAYACGLRVSESVSSASGSIGYLDRLSRDHVPGKGRRGRALPLWKENDRDHQRLAESRQSIRRSRVVVWKECEWAIHDEVRLSSSNPLAESMCATAAKTEPTLNEKRVSPHAPRHTCAMQDP